MIELGRRWLWIQSPRLAKRWGDFFAHERMIIPPKNLSKPHTNVTFRAIVIGFLLIPANTYFIMWSHLKYWSTLPTTISLIYNAVISLMILVSLNFLIQRFAPGLAEARRIYDSVRDALGVVCASGTRHDSNGDANHFGWFLVCYARKWVETAFLETSPFMDGGG